MHQSIVDKRTFRTRSHAAKSRTETARRKTYGRPLRCEPLEERQLLSITLPTIADQMVLAGAPLNLALNGNDSLGHAVNYSVSVSNSTVSNPQLTATVAQGNPSLRLTVDDAADGIHGEMVFQLFQDLAPTTVDNIMSLVNGDFYDGLTFHRVIQDFMIQGGDPNGDGSGGPGFQFDDEFNAALQFTGPGLLAMANSGDDTNGSQFFATVEPYRQGDFQYTIFGMITQGSDILDAINAVATDAHDKPLNTVTITDASIFYDTQNSVLRLSSPDGATGTADVTVTAIDSVTSDWASQTFHVIVAADINNDPPFLGPIDPIVTAVNTPVSFDIPATDVEGDAIYFDGDAGTDPNLSLTVDLDTGHATLTPSNGITGVYSVLVGVQSSTSDWDRQVVPLYINPAAPSRPTLLAASDTGSSSSDKVTSLNNAAGKTLQFQVDGVLSGAVVQLFANNVLIGEATASGTSVVVTTNGTAMMAEGANSITAKQTLKNQAVNVGNLNTTVDLASAISSALTMTVDTTAPTVTINKQDGQADPTTTLPVIFKVVFSQAVSDFTADDVILGGTASGQHVASITGSGTTYNVVVTATGYGTIVATIGAGAAHDAAGNANSASISTDNSIAYQSYVPTVTINQKTGQADATNVSPIHFTVVFSDAVSNFTETTDVTLSGTATGTKVEAITPVGTDGKTYDVEVSATGNVTITATIGASTAVDADGNGNAASTSTDNTVTFDKTKPTVTVNQATGQADPASGPIRFRVVFNESVSDFVAEDVTLGGTATDATVTSVTPVGADGKTYDVTVTPTSKGTVIATIAADAAHDEAGNGNAASTSTDNTVTYGGAIPTVTINQAARQAGATNVVPVHFTVVFSESVNYFDPEDVTLTGTATGKSVTKITPSGTDGTTYDVEVTATGEGTIVATIGANMVLNVDENGNTASTSTDNSVTYDATKPTVTVKPTANPTKGPIYFTVEFSEPVTGFAIDDVTLTGTATGAVIASATDTGDGKTYNVLVTATGDGTIAAAVETDAAADAAGNLSLASTNTDNIVTYDATVPTVTINQKTGQADATATSPVLFTVVFSEPVTSFAKTNVTLSGTATGKSVTKVTPVGTDGTTYDVEVTATGTGTIIATIGAGKVHDAANNGNAASTSTDNSVTYDITGPTVTIEQAATQADPTTTSPLHFTVVFSEPVTDFKAANITLDGTATGKTVTNIAGNGTTYDVQISASGNGTISATMGAGTVHDAAGNANLASTSTDNSVIYDTGAPTVTINQAASQADPTAIGLVHYTVVFSQAVADFTAADVTLAGTAFGRQVTSVTGSGTRYDVAVSASGSGTIIAAINAGVATAGGKTNAASTSTDNAVTYNNPNPTMTSPNGGEVWVRGSSHEITWSWAGHTGSSVRIDLYKGTSLNRTIAFSTPNDGSYTWTIPANMPDGDAYRMKISPASQPTISDSSDGVFSIHTTASASQIGVYDVYGDVGTWYLDVNGSRYWDDTDAAAKITYGWASATPVAGDWNGDGKTEVGMYTVDAGGQGWWYLDVNANGVFDSDDAASVRQFGQSGDTPVVGDWNGDGKSEIGVYAIEPYQNYPHQGTWYLDVTGNGTRDTATKAYDGWQGATPVVGDWNGDGKSEIGVYAVNNGQGMWYLDVNGNRYWDNTDAAATGYHGWQGATPVVGDWNGDGKSEIGVYAVNNGQGMWYLDINGNRYWDNTDAAATGYHGWVGATPVVGNWRQSNGSALRAAMMATTPASGISPLTPSDLQPIVQEAIARWAATGISADVLNKMRNSSVTIADLPGSYLGRANGEAILIDADAAENGWFVDGTPTRDEEFSRLSSQLGLRAINPQVVDRIDLLTVVEHELGHVAGLDDLDFVDGRVMDATLATGVRRSTG